MRVVHAQRELRARTVKKRSAALAHMDRAPQALGLGEAHGDEEAAFLVRLKAARREQGLGLRQCYATVVL